MLSEALSLKIAAIFIIFLLSLGGVCCPFVIKDTSTNFFQIMKSLSAGVILGLAMIHLLPDANADLSTIFPDYEPLAFSVACLGVVIVLGIDQAIYFIKPDVSAVVPEAAPKNSGDLWAPSSSYQGMTSTDISTTIELGGSKQQQQEKHQHDGSCVTKEVLEGLIESNGMKDVVAAYIMEASIAIHSIIIGIDLGLLGGENQTTTLISLIIALAFHQFFEGIGLGATIFASRASLGTAKITAFVAFFSLSVPLGIVVGIIMDLHDGDSNGATVIKGVANSLTAGTLLYISLCEMTVPYFSNPDILDKPYVRASMVVSFAAGVAAMAILAIWA